MKRSHLVTAIVCVAMAASGAALAQHHGHHGMAHGKPMKHIDGRTLVEFPPGLVQHTLRNMRHHLQALEQITSALAEGAFDRAATTAEQQLGMSSLQSHGAHEVGKFMPDGMRQAGMTMHRAASRFAIEAQSAGVTAGSKAALKALGEVMQACNACHASYRLQ
ncbi:MAG: hypothetical protein ACK5JT_18440 [Hyphomicrobiaceae bacterium]